MTPPPQSRKEQTALFLPFLFPSFLTPTFYKFDFHPAHDATLTPSAHKENEGQQPPVHFQEMPTEHRNGVLFLFLIFSLHFPVFPLPLFQFDFYPVYYALLVPSAHKENGS